MLLSNQLNNNTLSSLSSLGELHENTVGGAVLRGITSVQAEWQNIGASNPAAHPSLTEVLAQQVKIVNMTLSIHEISAGIRKSAQVIDQISHTQ